MVQPTTGERIKPAPAKPAPKPASSSGNKAASDAAKKAADAAKKAAADAAKKAAAAVNNATKAIQNSVKNPSAETAAGFGYTLAFFNSNPELKALLQQATAGGWNEARFVAALQNTKWFRTSSESYRKYVALQKGDPATLKQQLIEGGNRIQNIAGQIGAPLSWKDASALADTALKMGWGEDHIKRYLSTKLSIDKSGRFTSGAAATLQSQFKQTLADYGISMSDQTLQGYVRQGVQGMQDASSFKNYAQYLAASKYVALKDRIMAGETVRQIADPYIQSYGKVLEVNPENLSIDDPLIQRALQAKDGKGKPTTQTVYDFENALRNDPRWAKTNNARDTMTNTANAILKSFGVVS